MEDGWPAAAAEDRGQGPPRGATSSSGSTIMRELEQPLPLPSHDAPKPPGYVFVPKPQRVEGVSKKAAKRLWRQEMWKVKKEAKKEAKKAARHQQKQEDQAQHKAAGGAQAQEATQHDQEKEEDPAERQHRWVARATQRQEMREDFVRRCREGARVVVDCGFEEQMTEKELKSLGQQVMYMYASNKRAASPCFVHATE